MREQERLAIEWCQCRGLDPLEYVPFRFMTEGGECFVRDVPRYLAIAGSIIKRPGATTNGVAVH